MACRFKQKNKATPRKRLSARNRAAIEWLDKWMSTPDDMGEEWWAEFEAELKANRFKLRNLEEC